MFQSKKTQPPTVVQESLRGPLIAWGPLMMKAPASSKNSGLQICQVSCWIQRDTILAMLLHVVLILMMVGRATGLVAKRHQLRRAQLNSYAEEVMRKNPASDWASHHLNELHFPTLADRRRKPCPLQHYARPPSPVCALFGYHGLWVPIGPVRDVRLSATDLLSTNLSPVISLLAQNAAARSHGEPSFHFVFVPAHLEPSGLESLSLGEIYLMKLKTKTPVVPGLVVQGDAVVQVKDFDLKRAANYCGLLDTMLARSVTLEKGFDDAQMLHLMEVRHQVLVVVARVPVVE